MRQWRGGHARLALRLCTIQAGNVLIGEQAAPNRVGDDHQFGNQLVERAATLTFADLDRAGIGIGQVANNLEVVVVDALRRRRFAAPAFAGIGEMPQMNQLILERHLGQWPVDRFCVEPGLNIVMAQVGGDMHHLQSRFVGNQLENVVDRQIERDRRAIDAAGQRVVLHHGIGQHGDLVAGHVNRRQPGTRDAIERRAVFDSHARRGDMNTDARADTGQFDDRQRIVDFGGAGVVDREGADIGTRQIARQRRRFERREGDALRKLLVQKALEMQMIGRLDGAAFEQQLRRRQTGFAAGRLESLGFRLVAVRRVEQGVGQRANFRRQPKFLEFGDPGIHRQRLLALLFQTGQRRRENLGRRLAEAAFAFAVKIDGRRVHSQQHRSRFDRRRIVAVVIAGEIEKRELAVIDAFPQEIRLDLFGERRRLFQQVARRWLVETQQYRRGLDLAALAGRHFDLQGAIVVGHDTAGLEAAIFFEQYIHRWIITPRIQ